MLIFNMFFAMSKDYIGYESILAPENYYQIFGK